MDQPEEEQPDEWEEHPGFTTKSQEEQPHEWEDQEAQPMDPEAQPADQEEHPTEASGSAGAASSSSPVSTSCRSMGWSTVYEYMEAMKNGGRGDAHADAEWWKWREARRGRGPDYERIVPFTHAGGSTGKILTIWMPYSVSV